jgi:hypothetical protein
VLAMRRSVLNSIIVMSLTALTAAIGACATAPVDEDFSGLTQDQTPAQPEENASAKLPPATNPMKDQPAPNDAGTDAKTVAKDASPPPADSSTPPADSGGGTGTDCDPNDMSYYFKFITEASPAACPCSASQCCYLALGCVTK